MKINFSKRIVATCMPVLAIVSSLLSFDALAIATGTYDLSNHPAAGTSPLDPDGAAGSPTFGLRLDGLTTGMADEVYVFDFDNDLSNMQLIWDGTTIHIFGSSVGGQDIVSGTCAGCIDLDNDGLDDNSTAVWNIDFTYDFGIASVADGGVDDLQVDAHHQNFGTLSTTDLGGLSFDLRDHTTGNPLIFNDMAFLLGDEDGSGHRGYDGISGWGWLDYCDTSVIGPISTCSSWNGSDGDLYTSDWLFTATIVPVPAAVWLFASGMLGLITVARRKKS